MKTILVDALHTFVIENEGIFKKMHSLLEEYPNTKIILTNANEEQMVKFGLDKLPYALFTLKHNPEKTDPDYYKTLLKQFSLSAEDVIYFEHNEQAVKSAQSIGIETLHYDKNKKDLVLLKKFIDEHLN